MIGRRTKPEYTHEACESCEGDGYLGNGEENIGLRNRSLLLVVP